MNVMVNDSRIITIAQLKEFSRLNRGIKFRAVGRSQMYVWINEVLTRFRYFSLKKKGRGLVRGYLKKMTGLSDSQLTRIIAQKKRRGAACPGPRGRHCFPRQYGPSEIALLAQTDNAHSQLSGPATKRVLEREFQVFGREEYAKIKSVSVSHLYNLRKTRVYRSKNLTLRKTKAKAVSIGIRKKPRPDGRPGFIRVDSVHQGDLEGQKGVYHLNLVDEVTQWETVGCVEKISERYLVPLLEDLLAQFPFIILGFHSDNGSEYLNKVVSRLLNKLLIEQTKSRSRHPNDNGLVETKNGAVIRKHLGYLHIPRHLAKEINRFYQECFNDYLNYHRPCGFARIVIDKRGKEKRTYPQENYQTPYEKLKSLPGAQKYLKPGVSFAKLDKTAYQISDNESASLMQQKKDELSKKLKHMPSEMKGFMTFISCSYVD